MKGFLDNKYTEYTKGLWKGFAQNGKAHKKQHVKTMCKILTEYSANKTLRKKRENTLQ